MYTQTVDENLITEDLTHLLVEEVGRTQTLVTEVAENRDGYYLDNFTSWTDIPFGVSGGVYSPVADTLQAYTNREGNSFVGFASSDDRGLSMAPIVYKFYETLKVPLSENRGWQTPNIPFFLEVSTRGGLSLGLNRLESYENGQASCVRISSFELYFSTDPDGEHKVTISFDDKKLFGQNQTEEEKVRIAIGILRDFQKFFIKKNVSNPGSHDE